MASTGRLGRGASSLASVIMGLCAATAMSVLVVGFLSRPVAADDMVWCLNVVVGLPDDLNAENISLSYYPVVSCGEVQDSFLDEGLDYPDSSYHTDATYPVLGLYWWLESYNASAVGLEGAPKTTRGAVDTAVRKKFEEKNTKWTRPAYWQKLQEKRKKEEERKLIDEKYQKLRDRQASKLERPALPTSSTPGSKARSISPPNEKLAKLVSHESASHISNSVGKRDISTATRKREVTQSNSRPVDRTTSVGSKSAVSQFLSTRGSPSDQPTYGASHEMHVVAILGSLSYSDPIYTTMTVEGLDPAGIAPSIDDPGYFTISMSCQEAFVAGSFSSPFVISRLRN
ncbi:hypothetical protein Pelo_17135 [Pelomyxa schiedti]|nr:hypothetical protein Pelo_17135 [Pelomyxa schiedti]